MYGIVNQSIEELVTINYGLQAWEEILIKSGIEKQIFLTNEAYDDSITYQLASCAAQVLGVGIGDVFFIFGKWWVMHTCKKSYASMMKTGGSNLSEFILGLPSFHDRIQLMYPKLSPPVFKVNKEADKHFLLQYFSKRLGLQEFMKGILFGLGEYFQEAVEVKLLQSRDNGFEFEIFEIKWS